MKLTRTNSYRWRHDTFVKGVVNYSSADGAEDCFAKFTSLVRVIGTTEFPWSQILEKDCHSDVSPVNTSVSDYVGYHSCLNGMMEWRHWKFRQKFSALCPGQWDHRTCCMPLSLIGSIKILIYRTRGSWVYLPYLFTNCITRSCDLLDWFIQTCIGSTWFDVMTTWQRDKLFKNVFVFIIFCLIFMSDYSNVMAIKDKYWFFCFAFIHSVFLLVTFANE